jgi:hypothetical protein
VDDGKEYAGFPGKHRIDDFTLLHNNFIPYGEIAVCARAAGFSRERAAKTTGRSCCAKLGGLKPRQGGGDRENLFSAYPPKYAD